MQNEILPPTVPVKLHNAEFVHRFQQKAYRLSGKPGRRYGGKSMEFKGTQPFRYSGFQSSSSKLLIYTSQKDRISFSSVAKKPS